MKKIIIVLLITFSIITTYADTNSTKLNLNDFNSSWAKETINILVGRGIVNGYPDGSFKPNFPLQVDEFIKMVLVSKGYHFDNASPYWAQTYIDKALALGYIDNQEFSSYKAQITREQMSSIVTRAVGADAVSPSVLTELENFIYDKGNISYRYKEVSKSAYALGIITGYEDFTFRPMDTSTRAEAATVIHRLIEPTVRKPFVLTAEKALEYQRLYGSGNSNSGTTTPGNNTNQGTGTTTPTTPTDNYVQRVSANGSTVEFSVDKIIPVLQKYPSTSWDPKYKNFVECNDAIRNGKAVAETYNLQFQMARFMTDLFDRNYTQNSDDYIKKLMPNIRDWWYYRGVKYAPYDFMTLWAKETKDWNISSDFIMLTDTDLKNIYQNEDWHPVIRTRMFFRYNSHDNVKNIQFEIGKVGPVEIGKWYYVDADVIAFYPLSNAPSWWDAEPYTLWDIKLLSTAKLVEGQ